jgi:hypothetical protein
MHTFQQSHCRMRPTAPPTSSAAQGRSQRKVWISDVKLKCCFLPGTEPTLPTTRRFSIRPKAMRVTSGATGASGDAGLKKLKSRRCRTRRRVGPGGQGQGHPPLARTGTISDRFLHRDAPVQATQPGPQTPTAVFGPTGEFFVVPYACSGTFPLAGPATQGPQGRANGECAPGSGRFVVSYIYRYLTAIIGP